VERGRGNDEPAVAAQVEARGEADPVAHLGSGMGKVEVAAAAARYRLDRRRQRLVSLFESREARGAAVSRVDVDHHEAGDGAGDDGGAHLAAAAEPAPKLLLARAAALELLPAHDRPLPAALDGHHAPAAREVRERRFLALRRGHGSPPTGVLGTLATATAKRGRSSASQIIPLLVIGPARSRSRSRATPSCATL
jgi:hypothetical protein